MFKNKKLLVLRSATAIGAAVVAVPAMAQDSAGVAAAKAAATSGFSDLTIIAVSIIGSLVAFAAVWKGGRLVFNAIMGR